MSLPNRTFPLTRNPGAIHNKSANVADLSGLLKAAESIRYCFALAVRTGFHFSIVIVTVKALKSFRFNRLPLGRI